MEKQESAGQRVRDPKNDRPIWYLSGPFYRYAEDVKALTMKNGFRIIDADVTDDRRNAVPADQVPKLTVLPQYMTKAEAAAAEAAAAKTAKK